MSWARPGSSVMETVHHGPERQQEGSHMLFGLHRESSGGHAGQTHRWGDVLGAVPGEGARDAPSLFRARRNGRSDAFIHGLEIKIKTIDREDHQRYTIRVPAGLSFPSYCQKVTGMVRAEPADSVDPIFRANSPDLNPIDYFVWSVVGWKANEHRVASTDTPKHQITEVTESIVKEGVARASACFRTRLKKVIDEKGDHS